MDAPLAAHRVLEVLDHVGHIHLAAIDPGLHQRLVEHPPRRAHERLALDVLAVAGLLAHEHHLRLLEPFAEHRLGRALVEIAPPAAGGGLPQARERRLPWDELCGRRVDRLGHA